MTKAHKYIGTPTCLNSIPDIKLDFNINELSYNHSD